MRLCVSHHHSQDSYFGSGPSLATLRVMIRHVDISALTEAQIDEVFDEAYRRYVSKTISCLRPGLTLNFDDAAFDVWVTYRAAADFWEDDGLDSADYRRAVCIRGVSYVDGESFRLNISPPKGSSVSDGGRAVTDDMLSMHPSDSLTVRLGCRGAAPWVDVGRLYAVMRLAEHAAAVVSGDARPGTMTDVFDEMEEDGGFMVDHQSVADEMMMDAYVDSLDGAERSGTFIAVKSGKKQFMRKASRFILPVLLCFIVGGVAAWLQRESLVLWYPTLAKPAGTPPWQVFPAVWSVLYLCMGLSAGFVLDSVSWARRSLMRLWCIQLALNFLWCVLFFNMQSPMMAMVDIILLDVVVAMYVSTSASVSRPAAWLFVPYLCWTLYATYLNAGVVILNGTGF